MIFTHTTVFQLLLVLGTAIRLSRALPFSFDHPDDNSNDADLKCRPAKWTDILLFFIMNYVIHAFTVKSRPGETAPAAALYNTAALLLPFTGVIRAVDAIGRAAIFGKDPLQKAVRARALVVVGRSSDWKPTYFHESERSHGVTSEVLGLEPVMTDGMNMSENGNTHLLHEYSSKAQFAKLQIMFNEKDIASDKEVNIHGQCHLPQGYNLIILPVKAAVIPLHQDVKIDLASSYNFAKAGAAIAQVLFAGLTLYKARGNQYIYEGYAAYSITVIPYGLMSIVNLISNALTPDYESLYLIRSSVMAEAETRGGKFSGAVGQLAEEKKMVHTRRRLEYPFPAAMARKWQFKLTNDENVVTGTEYLDEEIPFASLSTLNVSIGSDVVNVSGEAQTLVQIPNIGKVLKYKSKTWPERFLRILEWVVVILSLVVPYIVVWWLTGFQKGQRSTQANRAWVISWFVLGQIGGALFAYWLTKLDDWKARVKVMILGSVLVVPSIGGFITVAQEISRLGICTKI